MGAAARLAPRGASPATRQASSAISNECGCPPRPIGQALRCSDPPPILPGPPCRTHQAGLRRHHRRPRNSQRQRLQGASIRATPPPTPPAGGHALRQGGQSPHRARCPPARTRRWGAWVGRGGQARSPPVKRARRFIAPLRTARSARQRRRCRNPRRLRHRCWRQPPRRFASHR